MKKLLLLLLGLSLCTGLTACKPALFSGAPVTYYTAAETFSISLPVSDEDDWVTGEDADGNVLKLSHADDTLQIQLHRLPKAQANDIAHDLPSYRDYATVTLFSEFLSSMKLVKVQDLQSAQLLVPDFAIASAADTFSYKGAKGFVVFMESTSCYYSYLVIAVEEIYDANEEALLESAASLRELAKPAETVGAPEGS